MRRALPIVALVLGVAVLALCFANVEIQIEGPDGWAAKLPVTFRVERHWLLELFWGGRPMTGYHAWVFTFMALVFHFPLLIVWRFTLKLEARILASLMIFWIVEDFLWFLLNPAYGLGRLLSRQVPWHRHWLLGLPTDYWSFTLVAAGLYWYSFRRGRADRNA